MLKKSAPILLAFLVSVCILIAQEAQPPAKPDAPADNPPAAAPDKPPAAAPADKPAADAAKSNPVKATPESLAKAKKTYNIDCAMCHGETGDGKGDMAEDIKNVTDFTKPDALKDKSDAELFTIIRKGKGDMPPEGDRAKNDDVWGLVNYVRELAKKK